MKSLQLVTYDKITKSQYEDYISEWEINEEKIIPSVSSRNGKSFAEMMNTWTNGEKTNQADDGMVAYTLYFLIDSNKKIVGSIAYRHQLNNTLSQNGGHIGYGIRKSERGKGYAAQMLSMLLSHLKEKVLLTCNDDNIASIKTIERCNGKLTKSIVVNNIQIRHYWID